MDHSLKDLAQLNSTHVNGGSKKENSSVPPPVQATYFEQGLNDSKASMGRTASLSTSLEDLYQSFIEECRNNEVQQKSQKQPDIDQQNRVLSEIYKKETYQEIKQAEYDKLETQIHELDINIAEVKIYPKRFGISADKRPIIQLYFGWLILIPIAIYLFVFYASASYSAFFKSFDTDNLSAAIFDAQALYKAFSDGTLEGFFVSTMTFVFMGIGFSIHMLLKSKSYLKIGLLIAFTFMFDAILAYQIDLKAYEFTRTLDSPDFNLGIAFLDVQFWGIIFAGFVVYIIGGLVFDFTMKEHQNWNTINQYIRKLKEDKANLIDRKAAIKNSIDIVAAEVASLKEVVDELQKKIDSFIFPRQRYLKLYSGYVNGWIRGVSILASLPENEKTRLIQACQETAKFHCAKNNLEEDNH